MRGSQAWVWALARAGVLTPDEAGTIQHGLAAIASEIEQGAFVPAPADEDIHTAIERTLTERIGTVAGKMHTGRSRNDQVATDFRLWTMAASPTLAGHVLDLQKSLLQSARGDLHAPMPGYTHLRQAQPITWGHWALSHFWPLVRDVERFDQAGRRAAVLPLGSAALAGTSVAIDRERLARDLGFSDLAPNSLDAVSDRDFAAEFLFASAMLGVHLSRLAEQLIIFSTTEFGLVELDDAFTTGSSLMPNKRNPDPLELARGKAGRLIGHLTGLLTTLKALPSAYDKDLQEDKEPVFDAFDTLAGTLPVLVGLIESLHLNTERMRAAICPETFAVDLADWLAARGVPFRQAHELVGMALQQSEKLGVEIDRIGPDDWRAISPDFGEDVHDLFDVDRALERRAAVGGTAAAALRDQLKLAEAWLKSRNR